MKQIFFIVTAYIFCLVQIGAKEANAVIKYNIYSPDGPLSLEFISKVDQNKAMHLFYHVTYNGIQVIQESALDIVLDNHLSEFAMEGTPDNNYHFIADMDFVLKKDTAVN